MYYFLLPSILHTVELSLFSICQSIEVLAIRCLTCRRLMLGRFLCFVLSWHLALQLPKALLFVDLLSAGSWADGCRYVFYFPGYFTASLQLDAALG
jgi:hypothetical protein